MADGPGAPRPHLPPVGLRSPGRRGGPPGGARHALPAVFDDQAGDVGGRHDAVRGGRLRTEGPSGPLHPVVLRHACVPQRLRRERRYRTHGGPLRVWHLLTHTSGLTYGFHHATPVDAMYRAGGFEWGSPADADLAECCDRWAGLPLLFQPGTEWNYGVSTDVLGRLVEVASGQSLDQFFSQRIFEPLGMTDTAFSVPPEAVDRLAALYMPAPKTRQAVRLDAMGAAALEPPRMLSGGGGLVGTAADYHRFAGMLLGGGQLDGVRLLGTRTVRYMTQNHLPGGQDLEQFGRPLFAETTYDGVGFGLGFSVVLDPVKNKVLGTAGDFGWGGAASTVFWVDPAEKITAVFLTQLLPSSTHPIRPQLKQLLYQALVD